MIILKMILLALIFAVCTILGMSKAHGYSARVDELKKIKNSIEMLKSKIEFTYEPIPEIFDEISKIIYKDKFNIFKFTINKIKENNDLNISWNEAVEIDENLTVEDKENIKLFGKLLGKTDKHGQINEINLLSNVLDSLIESAENEKDKNYKLFKTLGMASGIGICIILI